MTRCTTKYNSSVEVGAYDTQPMTKRPRKGRTSAQIVARAAFHGEADQPQDADQDRLRVGHRRTTAITNVLTHCTPESYQLLELHMVWVGDL